ncbi:unnamed protein product [Closterium sp. NIES-65]|nr:unnamed protein product [Closterium sp. NIES-65]
MTVGKDVSMLFTDVVNCMQTENLELKKLVYLYLINYAKSQPDLAILAVNTFVKDSQDPNPLIRALAVRTMGCIRVDRITEYLCDPLQRCLKDDDPYVRKTAAICVAKLHDINAELVEDRGFLDILRDMISDSNPMVVANAVAALSEIQEGSSKPVFDITPNTVFKLLAALNECTEWGQVFILDSLSKYKSRDAREAEGIVERVTPRLQHANSAVVLSAVKVILLQMELITSTDLIRNLCKKMAPPMVTLLSSEPEIQYVALRNINLVVQKRPSILAHEIKVFFCKYNDPIYVKMEKLEIMIRLASERNIDQVLLEFKEYATEVDVDFVRKAVRAIGRCAIKLEKAAERCINVLLDLIKIKVNYVVQEAIVVIKDIFRRYPNTYESIIATLCESLDNLDEPEAKASMIWIIGEYAERIDNADELLEGFLETFLEEPSQTVLNNATQETDNPDLRDRAYVYWRLLSTDPEAAKDIVLAEKPTISDEVSGLDPDLLAELLRNIATLSSVYQKPPSAFVSRLRSAVPASAAEPSEEYEESSAPVSGGAPPPAAPPAAPAPSPAPAAPAPAAAPAPPDLLGDLMGLDAAIVPVPEAPSGPSLPVLLAASAGQGLQINGQLERKDGQVVYRVKFDNNSSTALDGFMMQLNKNSFGISAPAGVLPVPPLQPGASATADLPLTLFQNVSPPPPSSVLQVAVKNNQQPVWYFTDKIRVQAFFTEEGRMERGVFLETWKALPDSNEVSRDLGVSIANIDSVSEKLASNNVFFVAKRHLKDTNQHILYLSAKLAPSIPILLEITIDVCSLANNHVLDFQAQGMHETMESLTRVDIRFAGCGRNLAEASAPAFITLPGGNSSLPPIQLALFSAADHFKYWAATEDSPGIHLIDPERVTDADLHRIACLVAAAKEPSQTTTAGEPVPSAAAEATAAAAEAAGSLPTRTLAVVCMHWGPNYAWHPSPAIRRLAHALIDRCGANLVIGTSAHHIQGVEFHHGAPILYSCGDFIDDYAVDEEYRNDLSFLFHLHLDPVSCCFTSISLFPNAIRRLQASVHVSLEERRWLYSHMRQLCAAMGTTVTPVDRSLRQLEIVLSREE